MGYKSCISKKDSRRFLKLPTDHDVGLISQHVYYLYTTCATCAAQARMLMFGFQQKSWYAIFLKVSDVHLRFDLFSRENKYKYIHLWSIRRFLFFSWHQPMRFQTHEMWLKCDKVIDDSWLTNSPQVTSVITFTQWSHQQLFILLQPAASVGVFM